MEKPCNSASRRRRTRRLVRRLTLTMGLALALSPTSTSARERGASFPRRADMGSPPWIEPGGFPSPPRPLGSTEGQRHHSHPAIHGHRSDEVVRLFPRHRQKATADPDEDRAAAIARHPAGKGRLVGRVVEVERGDSLWSLAEERVGADRAAECWPDIYRANRRVIGSDPDHIEPGQRLRVPKACR